MSSESCAELDGRLQCLQAFGQKLHHNPHPGHLLGVLVDVQPEVDTFTVQGV